MTELTDLEVGDDVELLKEGGAWNDDETINGTVVDVSEPEPVEWTDDERTDEIVVVETEDGETREISTGNGQFSVVDVTSGTEDDEDNDEDETEIVTDGGQTDTKDKRDVDELVREYSADGHLYAYREDDEHVIVSRGNEPAARWTKRAPAERQRVVPGQQLWTVPDNWEQVVSMSRDTIAYGIFRAPETGQHVKLSIPTNDHLVDAWYAVQAVGELTVEPVGDLCHRRTVTEIADDYAEQGHENDAEAMREVARAWGAVETDLEMAVEWVRDEGLDQMQPGDQPIPADSDWTIEFGRDRVFRPGETLTRETDIEDYEMPLDIALDELRERAGLPSHYKFQLDVDDSDRPMDHDVRALIEAGCSPPQALDYYMTELAGLSQSAWAEERDKAQPSISKNVSKAEGRLRA